MASFVVVKETGFKPGEIGLNLRKLPLQGLIALAGFPLGFIEYVVLRPGYVPSAKAYGHIWAPAMVLIVCNGFMEELIFRGIIYTAALEAMGSTPALLYTSFIFVTMHNFAHLPLGAVLFILFLSLLFTGVFAWQKSILGLSLAHGFMDLVLCLKCPLSTVIGTTVTSTFGLSAAKFAGFIASISLVILLCVRELARAEAVPGVKKHRHMDMAAVDRVLNIGIVPLLYVFGFIIFSRIMQIIA